MLVLLSKFLILLIPCLVSVAFFTLLERKVLGIVGFRLGPFKVSFLGFLQPIGDAVKLMNKEINSLSNFSVFFYYFTSFIMLSLSISLFTLISYYNFSFTYKISILVFFLILGLNSLNSILSGWSTFSKFSLLGSLRTVSQLVSYEIGLYMIFFFLLSLSFSFDLSIFVFTPLFFFSFCYPLVFFSWMVCCLAELNRTPYDFSEGESELVSGFNLEFGSSCFTFIFLAEYGMIFFFMFLSSFIFFFYYSFFSPLFFFLVIWIRSVLPRYRFDKLMGLSWKVIIPQLGFMFILYFLLVV